MQENKNKYKEKTVLVIDDDIDFLEKIKIQMQFLGFNVVTGHSEAESEKLISETNYDLAIFDLMLENTDSGFVMSYKSKQAKPDVPVIIITNVTHETGLQFDVTTGEMRSWIKADIIMDKDFRIEQLEGEINKLMVK